MTTQPELPIRTEAPLFEIREDHPNIDWFVRVLEARNGWMLAEDVLRAAGKPVVEYNRRWVRRLADKSKGRVAGGQQGYKLVKLMTGEEFHHWRNWMKSQADKMTARIIEADRVFYARAAVDVSTGILTPNHPDLDYAI